MAEADIRYRCDAGFRRTPALCTRAAASGVGLGGKPECAQINAPAYAGPVTISASVSPATLSDARELAALAALTFPLACPPAVTAAESAAFVADHLSEKAFERYLADDSSKILLSRQGGELVGYALLVLRSASDPEVARAVRRLPGPAAELSKCYVHPAAHGTGTAAALMQAAMDTAATAGSRALWLGVNDLNLRAQSFYRKSGFIEAGRRSFTVGPHVFRDFILALPLPHSAE